MALDTWFSFCGALIAMRRLSPRETAAFENWLSGPNARGNNAPAGERKVEYHVTQQFSGPVGSPQMAADMWSRLDSLV